MKKNTLYLFILLLITGLNTSCNYLDIVPDETATEKDAFANPRAALRYLYSCYGYLPQSNMVQSCMDFTGDETISPSHPHSSLRIPVTSGLLPPDQVHPQRV